MLALCCVWLVLSNIKVSTSIQYSFCFVGLYNLIKLYEFITIFDLDFKKAVNRNKPKKD